MVTDPPPSSRSTWSPTGSDDHFADQAESWSNRYRQRVSFRARLNFVGESILGALDGVVNAQVLDFGSGTGLFAAIASQTAALVVSVDRSVPMLRAGQQDTSRIIETIGEAGLRSSVGRVLRIAGDDRAAAGLRCRFDLISAVAVLEYVDDCERVMAHLASALAPGGRILVTVPNPRSPLRWGVRAARPVLQAVRPSASRLTGQSYLLVRPRGDRPPWLDAARTAGLAVERIQPVPFATSGPASLLHPNLLIHLVKG